ncbi:histidine phosphatase family protein [Methylocystis bryophila]|uniref:Histidine phosphatase family protein n=1 Tax=Methylocystis bryophila TaxID=655015 RepID=A0A1W6N0M1_9HYPH|nr:histidine phosphatase family protein [Methylocystis bryophila]ARN83336.1 hypothetical protein B1812_03495 [Methylocystis bryophila]
MRMISVLTLLVGLFLGLAAASAQPRQIIILRHGEKTDGPDLCPTGFLRAKALAEVYLGKGAAQSLFGAERPAAFYAITDHTRETIEPSAKSWGMQLLLPATDKSKFTNKIEGENRETEDAAKDVLTNPSFGGKIVVMTWEHKHIANKDLDSEYQDPPVTLRRLLNLDQYAKHHPDVKIPETWSGDNYDYFWIVDYADPKSAMPTKVKILKQTFPAPYESVPANDWKEPEPRLEGCKQ